MSTINNPQNEKPDRTALYIAAVVSGFDESDSRLASAYLSEKTADLSVPDLWETKRLEDWFTKSYDGQAVLENARASCEPCPYTLIEEMNLMNAASKSLWENEALSQMPESELGRDQSSPTWLKRVFAWTSQASIKGSKDTGASEQGQGAQTQAQRLQAWRDSVPAN